jgi:hypothetical protein
MATPLRKDQPEFNEEEGLTTADLAQGERPVTEPRGPQAVTGGRGPEQASAVAERSMQLNRKSETTEPLFPSTELESLRTRWKEVQTAFVDEPRKAVEQADGLVASAMKRLAEVFAEERSRLEQQWDRGDNVSTEDLRVALQRYRSFFDRLLSV